jgi:hypothetical protein
MNIGAAFPSKYLKASDIPDGQRISVVLDRVEIENPAGNGDPDDNKPVLYFVGKQKGMVLNKTNSNTIAAALGSETESWHGKTIQLYASETSFDGRMVACVRVKVPPQPKGVAPNGGGRIARTADRVADGPAAMSEILGEEPAFQKDDIPF